MAEAPPPRQLSLGGRAAVFGLALILGACSTVVPRTAPPSAPPPPPPAIERPVQQGALPEDRERHRVALLVPLSGSNAGVGQSIADAAVLALADTKDHALRVTTYDTAGGAAVAAQKALADGNQLILGPLLADDVRAVSAVSTPAHVPVIAFSNDVSVATDSTWLLGFTPAQSIERVVRYAKSRGLTRFAGLMPAGLYGRNASNALLRAAEAAGGSVVAMQSYNRSPASISAAIAALAKQSYDAVLIADSGRIAVAAIPQIRKKGGTSARLLGTELWNAEPGLNAVPALAGAWYASVEDTRFDQLSARYRQRYGHAPYRLASLGYDAVLLTVRIASDWKMGGTFPVDRLADDGGFSGVDGVFRFGKSHVAERALAVHQLAAGGDKVVSAAATGF